MAYADDNSIGDVITTIERNADVLLSASKDIGLEVSTEETKYMELGLHRGTITNKHIRVSGDKVKPYKYLCFLLKNLNSNHETIKCKLKVRNSCYYLVLTLLSSCTAL